MTAQKPELAPPLGAVSSRETVRRALNHLVASILKESDAPASAASHLDRAIVELLKVCPDWQPWDKESAAVVAWAKDHLADYQQPNDKLSDGADETHDFTPDAVVPFPEVPGSALADEQRRADQLGQNCGWLIGQIDRIHAALCPGRTGTWQDRVRQAVEAAESLSVRSPLEVLVTT